MLLLGLMYMPMMILRLLMLRKRDMGLGELREISRCWRLWVHIMIGIFKEMFFRKREKRQPSKNTVERWVYWIPLCIVDDKNTPGKRSFRAGKVELSTAKACSIFFFQNSSGWGARHSRGGEKAGIDDEVKGGRQKEMPSGSRMKSSQKGAASSASTPTPSSEVAQPPISHQEPQ